jgi:hypothetical protein
MSDNKNPVYWGYSVKKLYGSKPNRIIEKVGIQAGEDWHGTDNYLYARSATSIRRGGF